LHVIFIYFLRQRSQVPEYKPQEHALQALLIFINLCVYMYASQ